MPEGDTLYRIAHRLEPLLVGCTIEAAAVGRWWDELDPRPLVGGKVTSVAARGKHLLIALEEGPVVHSHLGMTGSWHAYPRGQRWTKPARQAALQLTTLRHEAVCFSPEILEITTQRRADRAAMLARLGPDLMRPLQPSDWQDLAQRLELHRCLPVGEALLQQAIACGVGNVYKSETLFLAGLDPWRQVGDLDADERLELYRLAQRLMLRNRRGGVRRTRFAVDGPPLWVYGRAGEPCLRCGGAIAVRRQGAAGRTTYWCRACQPPQGRG